MDPAEIGEHWIKFRIPRSTGDQNRIADVSQAVVNVGGNGGGVTTQQNIAKANREVFALLVEEWSFSLEPTAENYDRLTDWSGNWVNACIGDAQRRAGTPGWAEKKGRSSSKRASSRRTSASAASSDS